MAYGPLLSIRSRHWRDTPYRRVAKRSERLRTTRHSAGITFGNATPTIYNSGPMTRSEIEEKLIGIVREEKDIPDDVLTRTTLLVDAGIDSLDALNILFAIEEEFNISIPDDRARAIKTFGDMIDIVAPLVGRLE
jgi:acyl carrier protein